MPGSTASNLASTPLRVCDPDFVASVLSQFSIIAIPNSQPILSSVFLFLSSVFLFLLIALAAEIVNGNFSGGAVAKEIEAPSTACVIGSHICLVSVVLSMVVLSVVVLCMVVLCMVVLCMVVCCPWLCCLWLCCPQQAVFSFL